MKNTGRSKNRRGFLCLSILFLGVFISCQSMQKDNLVSTSSETANTDILALEASIVPLDSGFSRDALKPLRQRITELEKKNLQDSYYKSQLAAWSGRLSLIEGNTSDARKALQNSDRFYPGNIQAMVLSIRLETDLQKRLEHANETLKVEPNAGELFIEKARALFDLKRYSESAAAFDTAFNLFNQNRKEVSAVYEEVYRPSRTRAWDLRNVASDTKDTSAVIVQKNTLTWLDVINLTNQETKLLDFLTAGRTWQANELFTRLVNQGFIPQFQDVSITEWPNLKASPNDTVLRSGAAWFLWHLYAENRADARLLTRYSSRYRQSNDARSPIPDVPALSPFFDSILGCVEWEFMALPDGKNFQPGDAVRGTSFHSMLKKVSP